MWHVPWVILGIFLCTLVIASVRNYKRLTTTTTHKETTMIDLLVCDCGDCRHWEITPVSIICKTCGKEFPVPDLKAFVQTHVELHPSLNWKQHER